MDYLTDMGDNLAHFPVLHTVHCLATSASIRSQPGALEFAHSHPLASMAGNLMIVNAGGILVAAALGKPLIGPFVNVPNGLLAMFIWWMVYFGPGDIAFELYKFKPLQVLLMLIRETRRCKKILWAVELADSVFKGQWIVLVLVGALGGCSGKFLQTTEESIRKKSSDIKKGEFLQISFVTKASLLIAAVYTAIKADLIGLTIVQGILLNVCCLCTINLAMSLAGLPDPFHPIANATWKVVSIGSRAPETKKVDEKKSE